MEIITKLYESEYFVIGLFSAIAILIFLFIIIAILGRKEKKEAVPTVNADSNIPVNNAAFADISAEPQAVEVPVAELQPEPVAPVESVVEPIAEQPVINPENVFTAVPETIAEIVPEPIVTEVAPIVGETEPVTIGDLEIPPFNPEPAREELIPVAEPIVVEPAPVVEDFQFDTIAEPVTQIEPTIPQSFVEQPVIEEPIFEQPVIEEVAPVIEQPTPSFEPLENTQKLSANQFSSVFVANDAPVVAPVMDPVSAPEPVIEQPIIEEVVPEVTEIVAPEPVAPAVEEEIELPKPAGE